MYKLFTKLFEANNSIIKPPGFELIKRIYQREILNIVNYYHNRVYAVQSQHFLCRLLDIASISSTYDLDRYLEIALARSPYVAKHFKFTSDLSYGEFKDGVFYGPGHQELIIYNEEYFDRYEAYKNWRNVQAIRVLDHQISDSSLLLPTGKKNTSAEGFVSITINLPLLLVQYKGFMAEQAVKQNLNNDSLLGVTHFVHMYVLPNMLYSHIEIVILNRLLNLYYGAPMSEPLKRHPFPVVNYDGKLDKILYYILEHIERAGIYYYSLLKNVPSIFMNDMQQVLLMPDIAKTRQQWWSMLTTRMKVMQFLIDVGGERAIRSNGVYINRAKVDYKRLLDENIIKVMLPENMYYDQVKFIEQVLDI